jgi:hypothetical protein
MADNFKFSQDYELIPPQKQKSYPISTTEWGLIKRKVGEIKENTNSWYIIGSILLGTSLPTFITALIGDFQSPKSTWICWSACLVTGLSGGLAFYFGKEQGEAQAKSKDDVIDFMKTIEDRFQNSVASSGSESNSNISIQSAKYGIHDKFIDLTNKVGELVEEGVLEIQASNELGGDPYPGKNKILIIDATINGVNKKFSVREGATLKIE